MQQIQFNRMNVYPIKLFTKVGFIPGELCISLIDFANNPESGFSRVNNRTPLHWDIECDTGRVPLVSQLNTDLSNILNPLWEEAITFYGFDVSYIENYEIKRYNEKDYVTEHSDQFYGTSGTMERKLTLLAQLNESYNGGELQVVKTTMPKHQGTVIVLPSYYPHEVKPVTSGARYSLNCWAWGKFWK